MLNHWCRDNPEVDDVVAARHQARDDPLAQHHTARPRIASDYHRPLRFDKRTEGGGEVHDVSRGEAVAHLAAKSDMGDPERHLLS